MATSNPLPGLQVTGPDDTMEITTPGGNADDMIDIDLDISGVSPGKDQEGDYLLDDASDYGQQPEGHTETGNHQDHVMEDEDDFLVDDDDGGMVEDTNEDVPFRDASYDEDVEDAPVADNANPGHEIDLQDREVNVVHFDDPPQDSAPGDLNSTAPTTSHLTEQAPSLEPKDPSQFGRTGDSTADSYEVPESSGSGTNAAPPGGIAEGAFQAENETWNDERDNSAAVHQSSHHDSNTASNQGNDSAAVTTEVSHPTAGDEKQPPDADDPSYQHDGEPTHSLDPTADGDVPVEPQSRDTSAEHQDHPNVEDQEGDNESELQFEDEDRDDTQDAPHAPENAQESTIAGQPSLHHDPPEPNTTEPDDGVQHTVHAEEASQNGLDEKPVTAADHGDDATYDQNEATTTSEHHSTPHANSTDRPAHHVVVNWGGETYSLFPSENGDGQECFVQDESLVNDSIQKLLGACRAALGESVSDEDVVEFEIVELGLYISEDCADAPSTTLSEILDIYVQLHQYNDPSDGEPLILQLTTRPRFARRLGALLQAAQDGRHISELTYFKQDSQSADDFATDVDQAGNDPDPSLPETDQADDEPSQPDSSPADPEAQDLQEEYHRPEDPAPEGDQAQQHAEYIEEDENYLDIFGEDEDAKGVAGSGAVQPAEEHPTEPDAPAAVTTAAEAEPDASAALNDDVLEFEDDDFDKPSPSTLRDEHTPQITQNGHDDESSGNKDTNTEPRKSTAPPSTSDTHPAVTDEDDDFINFDDDEGEEDQTSLKRSRDIADDTTGGDPDAKRRRSE